MHETDFAQLVRLRLAPLVLYAKQWDAESAEDIVHEAFLKLAGKIREGCPPRHPDSWLYSTVRNLAIDQFRSRQQFAKHSEKIALAKESWFVQQESLDADFFTEQLQKLPLEQREVIVAHLWGEQSFRTIAKMTGRPFSTVRRQFHDGIATLREFTDEKFS